MEFEIRYSREALDSLKAAPAHVRAEVLDVIGRILPHEPDKESKSRIKRLAGIDHPQFRMRVNKWRVFYDVLENELIVLIIDLLEEGPAHRWYSELESEHRKQNEE